MAETAASAAAVQMADPLLGELTDFGLRESRSYLGNKIASSKKLHERQRELNQALKRLDALQSDKHREVERESHKDTTNAYNLWVNRISKIEAEVASLNKKYEEVKKKKWRIWKRSNLSEKMAAKLKGVVELSDQLPNEPEPVLKEFSVPQIMGYPTLEALSISSSASRFTMGTRMSSEASDKDDFAFEITEEEELQNLNKLLKHTFLSLERIRDFLSLILTYPMTMPDQNVLEKWRDEAQALTDVKYFVDTDFDEERVSQACRLMDMLSGNPLKSMEVLIPNDILSKIEDGQRSMFNENAASAFGETVASASTSDGVKVLEMNDAHDVIPEDILNLATDLAVNQLIQTLHTRDIHHVMFSTRNESEKIVVVEKIKAALNDEYTRTMISNKYSRVLWVNATEYPSNTEAWIRQEIGQKLGLMSSESDQTENNDISLRGLLEDEMTRTKNLVFLVNGDGKGNVDPLKVGFHKKMLAGVVVLESSLQENDELLMAMDLEIRTEDHLMPWELFCRNAGREFRLSSGEIREIAVQIVQECRGHLLAIVLVARSLKNMELWRRALRKLRDLPPLRANGIPADTNKVMVNAFVNIIWNYLSEKEKECLKFSLNALGPEEKLEVHHIISGWIYNRLVYSQEEAEHIIRGFVHHCIFLKLERKYIQWPGEIYGVLRSLFELPPLDAMKKGGLGLTELQITGEWLLARDIELMDNNLSGLPSTINCPELTRLLLQGNPNLMEIPASFFKCKPHLLVLDLSYTSLKSLPSSLFDLKELQKLYLKGCKRLMELPRAIEGLKNLEILDLDGTPIINIPWQIGKLTKLKKLIVSFYTCHDIKESRFHLIPPGAISKLTHLLYLSIDVDPDNKHWDGNIEVILRDISVLQRLITLKLYIPRLGLLNDAPQCPDFRFVVGQLVYPRIISRIPRAVESKFKKNSCSLRFVNVADISNYNFEVIQRSKALFLERHGSIKNLSQIDKGGLAHLQSLIVGECNQMQTLIDGGCSTSPNLCWTFLCLYCMNNLRSICEVKARFCSLKTVELHNCPELTSIFTLNFLESLEKLEELIVQDCPEVSTLVSLESSESKEGIYLPRLRKVSLLYLPELISISSGLCIGPSLEEIGFYDCPSLRISTTELRSDNLKVIRGEKGWWDGLKLEEEWEKEGRPSHMFSPINEETDIFNQLLGAEEHFKSSKKEAWVQNPDDEADILSTFNEKDDGGYSIANEETSDDMESSRSKMGETAAAETVDELSVKDDVESSTFNEKETPTAGMMDELFVKNDKEPAKSNNKETSDENVERKADVFSTSNEEKDDDESFRSKNKETSEAEMTNFSAGDDVESSRSNKDILTSKGSSTAGTGATATNLRVAPTTVPIIMPSAAATIQLVAPPLGELVGFGLTESMSYLGSKIASSKQLDKRHRALNQALTWLLALRSDKHKEVERQSHKDTTNVYNLWLNRISEIETEVASLNNKYEELKKKKWRIWKRSNLSEKMAMKLKEAVVLSHQLPNDILVDKPPEPVLKEFSVPQIESYPTLQGALEEILQLLKNDRVKSITVCGHKGVGKTTIMQNLNNNEEISKLFDIVIFIRVPTNQTEAEIQQRIADRLLVERDGFDFAEVARRLHRELEKKRYLLILDEVDHQIDLNSLGIPNNNNGSKVVIVTRYSWVCKSYWVDRSVQVNLLSDIEAWTMFQNIVGPIIGIPGIRSIAQRISKRCSRLPLLIHIIASSFKQRETASSWQEVLDDFNTWPQCGSEGLDELYQHLEFCYDQLKNKQKQLCFLYTSLYPADSKIYTDYLVECWIAQGFLGDVNATTKYQSLRNQGIATLESLIDVSLLERGEQLEYVKINDCNRQFALHISSKYSECRSYVETEESELTLSSESWRHAKWVSMIGTRRDTLPTNQDCSVLQTLLLQKNLELDKIPPDYFDNMCNLLVLDLYGTKIRQLPSLSKLACLKAFYLNDCSDLKMLPFEIESLQQLEVLDIRGTGMNFIPCLINLRCLRISYIASSDHNRDLGNRNVISKLCKLEELIIEVKSFVQWCNDAEYIIQQIASLENLTTFKCSFPSSGTLGRFLETSKSWRGHKLFTSFQFFVGCENSKQAKIFESFHYRISKYVKYCNGDKKDNLAINKILSQVEAFELICHKDVRNLSEFVEASSLEYLRGFHIERCNQISTIVVGDESVCVLQNLEQLYLDNLPKLEDIFKGPLHLASFSKLHTLTLKNCPIMISIFSQASIQYFSALQKLKVEDGAEIKDLIMRIEDIEMERCVLPKLKSIVLANLSKLESICLNENFAWPSLELLHIQNCPKLRSLPFNRINAINLRTIKGDQEWWSNLHWTDNQVQERFRSAFSSFI